MTRSLGCPTPKGGSAPGTLSFPAGHLWLYGVGRIGNPRPAQVAAFSDRSDHTSPGRRPHSIHGNVTFPASTRRRSKTRRDPFAASSMTAQSRCSSTSLPPLMAHNRPAPPGWSRGRARRQPNRVAAFQPNSTARPVLHVVGAGSSVPTLTLVAPWRPFRG